MNDILKMNLKFFRSIDKEYGPLVVGESCRKYVIGFLFHIKSKCKEDDISFETLHVAIEIFDSIQVSLHEKFRYSLISVVCLMIASKIHDTCCFFGVKDCQHFAKAEQEDVISTEIHILKLLDYHCYLPTVYQLCFLIAIECNIPRSSFPVLASLLNVCVNTYIENTTRMKKAASIISFILHGLDVAWTHHIQDITGLSRSELLYFDTLTTTKKRRREMEQTHTNCTSTKICGQYG